MRRAYHETPAHTLHMMCACGGPIAITREQMHRPVDEWFGPDHKECPRRDDAEDRLRQFAEYHGMLD